MRGYVLSGIWFFPVCVRLFYPGCCDKYKLWNRRQNCCFLIYEEFIPCFIGNSFVHYVLFTIVCLFAIVLTVLTVFHFTASDYLFGIKVFFPLFFIRTQNNQVRIMWLQRLWCLTPLSAIFQLYCGDQFYWWRKREYTEKTTDLSQFTDKLNLKLYQIHLAMGWIRTHDFSGDRYWLHM